MSSEFSLTKSSKEDYFTDEFYGKLKRMQGSPGVQGTIETDGQGITVTTSFKNVTAAIFGRVMTPIFNRCRHVVRDIDPTDELVALRINTLKSEIMAMPEREYGIVVIQKHPSPFPHPCPY